MKKNVGLMICLFLSTTSFAFSPAEIFFHNVAWLLKKVGSTQSSLLLTNVKQSGDIAINQAIPIDFDKCSDVKNCQMRIRTLIEYHKIKENLQNQLIDTQQETIDTQKQVIEEQEQSIETQKQIVETQQDTIATQREIGKQKLVQGVVIGVIGTACVAAIGLIYYFSTWKIFG